jgi:hypothetical protein
LRERNDNDRLARGPNRDCISCQAELPEEAAFCPTCGASQTGELWEECEIAWWRGYVNGELVAVSPAEDGYRVIARSGPFRWLRKRPEPPNRKHAVACLAALTSALERDGWVRSGEGRGWCSYRFRRRLEPARQPAQAPGYRASVGAPR